ncbi:MAG: lysine--tRNA ligase [Thermoplasmata archaeon]
MAGEETSHLVRERREKAERLRARGVEPYPWSFPDRVPTATVRDAAATLEPGGEAAGRSFRVAGRLRTVRAHGKSAFLTIDDLAGELQLFVRVDELGEGAYGRWLSDLDPGDLLGAAGHALRTRRGEPSLLVRELTILAKAIEPPPEKFHGLQDPEERIRRRYVDLLSSAETRQRFLARTLLVRDLRRFLDDAGFFEVETAVLGNVAGGAAAAPFVTRSNYLKEDLQLRISLELPLKRLLVGGLERVYELGRVFRNEDLDSTHCPEFTELEIYWAYADYHDMRGLVERMYARLAKRVAELLPDLPAAREAPQVFAPPFVTVDWVTELERLSGISNVLEKDREELGRLARAAGATVPSDSPPGKFLDKLFEHYVEPTLDRPTFVLDYPEATTPLAKRHRSRPGLVERFELFGRGVELGNAYTELNDPVEQRRRFEEQVSARPDEHYAYDDDFVHALGFGMPPATGLGIGVDRAIMVLAGIPSIKEIILFPPVRSRG